MTNEIKNWPPLHLLLKSERGWFTDPKTWGPLPTPHSPFHLLPTAPLPLVRPRLHPQRRDGRNPGNYHPRPGEGAPPTPSHKALTFPEAPIPPSHPSGTEELPATEWNPTPGDV